MVGWHHLLNGHESEQTLGDGEGQGSLACCCSWGCKESDTSEQLNNTQYDVIDLKFRSNWVSFTFSALLLEEGGQSLDFSPII